MIYTLKDLRDQVLQHLDEAGDTGTTRTLVTNLLNQANQNRAMEHASSFLVWDIPAFFTTVIDDQIYALHEEFMRPLYFFNRTTKRYLKEVPERQLSPEGYRWNDDGGPAEHFVLWGRTQVKNQPTSASVIEMLSSDSADTGGAESLKVMIRGETVSGAIKAELLNPNGTNIVSTVNQYVKIMQVTKAGPWTGTMTLMSNSSEVVNLELDGCELGKMYQQLFLIEKPTIAETIEYRFYRNPIKMVNDYDQPDIPYPFSQLLVWDALVMMAGYNTEMNSQSVGTWRQMQTQMATALAQAMLEGQSLDARVRFVRPMDQWDHLDSRWP